MELWQIIQEPWALRALVASTMVGITCGTLGTFIVLRNMALIGDALSHAILPGVVVAFALLGYNTFGFFFGSVAAGLVSAVAITWIQQNIRTKNDAVIGIVFTAMFSVGVIGISSISRTGVHLDLKDFLFGNVLGVSDQDLGLTGMVMLMVLISLVLFYRYLFASTFQPTIASTMGIPVRAMHYYLMLLLSFAVVAAMQTVGVILVVAMLITPASTALLLAKRLPLVLLLSGVTGFLSSLTGLVLSIRYEMPPGPAIAVVSTIIYLAAALLSPEQGLLIKWWRKRHQRHRVRGEDILKSVFKISLGQRITLREISDKLSIEEHKMRPLLQYLVRRNFMTKTDKDHFQLTEAGKQHANSLVRAHRLWESYLVNEMGIDVEHIHEEAERFEHILTADQVDEVDKRLGYPALDPHGSPIPGNEPGPLLTLDHLHDHERARFAQRQPGAEITYQLWDMGLGPGDEFEIIRYGTGIRVRVQGKEIDFPLALAAKVSIERLAG